MSEVSDKVLVAAFNRGCERGRHGAKHYRSQCPYGEKKPLQREAWLAGYDFTYRPVIAAKPQPSADALPDNPRKP